ncbi:hypothetical protein CDAR_493921 [Caerostris darwini]|uniref:Uncharacterized protein n=1 Tax=Caerostris darwini TaxID=1538125 RepID=A0AAV4VTJ2_9ARAC|nr:hypothetical protein CDAR_493921 [Caerostris darwini]
MFRESFEFLQDFQRTHEQMFRKFDSEGMGGYPTENDSVVRNYCSFRKVFYCECFVIHSSTMVEVLIARPITDVVFYQYFNEGVQLNSN